MTVIGVSLFMKHCHGFSSRNTVAAKYSRFATASSLEATSTSSGKGKLLVLGGTGFLGQCICRRALLEGYQVTSVSRRGIPPPEKSGGDTISTATASSSSQPLSGSNYIDYRRGDARQPDTVTKILQEGGYIGVVHCIGLLFDDASGLGAYNRLVSGSGSIPDENSSYDSITRVSAFNAIDAAIEYAKSQQSSANDSKRRLPFVFTSAAEAGWPDVAGGPQIEQFLAPDWLRRYLAAKRAVEERLTSKDTTLSLRPVIVRPSLIYSLDRPASYLPVGAFFVGNRLGLPFVDRPVTVQSLANAVVRSLSREEVEGVLRYPDIDALNQ
ncbi:NAD dependent epimerase/dehydratase family protein [Nitzschia inconspicua]|uniref:NAD dependent epimerase/dehydratase family protein n=1 Tax=Nitzschia inconspicua TaxID=303405 RepID=A0A9K3PDZ1_9STRA|nr:NAD dependent epimerase/dehydratase family protein [Nitzschia inconspicua]